MYFFDNNPVNPDFRPRIIAKIYPLGLWAMPHSSKKIVKIRSQLFQLSDGQTNRQTNKQAEVKT